MNNYFKSLKSLVIHFFNLNNNFSNTKKCLFYPNFSFIILNCLAKFNFFCLIYVKLSSILNSTILFRFKNIHKIEICFSNNS